MQTKLSSHHLNGQPNRARGMPVPLIRVCDPVTHLCLPPGAAQDVLRCYLSDDNIVGQDHARPHLTVVMLHEHGFDAAPLRGGGIPLRRALRIPPGKGFGVVAEVGGQGFSIVRLNETDAGSRNVHLSLLRSQGQAAELTNDDQAAVCQGVRRGPPVAGGSPAARTAYVQLWWASTPAAPTAVHGQQRRCAERSGV